MFLNPLLSDDSCTAYKVFWYYFSERAVGPVPYPTSYFFRGRKARERQRPDPRFSCLFSIFMALSSATLLIFSWQCRSNAEAQVCWPPKKSREVFLRNPRCGDKEASDSSAIPKAHSGIPKAHVERIPKWIQQIAKTGRYAFGDSQTLYATFDSRRAYIICRRTPVAET